MEDLLMRRRELLNESAGGGVVTDPYTLQPFTMISRTSVNVEVSVGNKLTVTSLKYNKNNTGWVNLNLRVNSLITTISLSEGDTLSFIGEGSYGYLQDKVVEITTFFAGEGVWLDGHVDLEGNIMSLIGGDDFINCTTVPDYCFYNGILYFDSDYSIRDITNLRMTATTVGAYSFYRAFFHQQPLQGDAKYLLPATNISEYCYYQMFNQGRGLITPPDLPATTIEQYCYYGMFGNCQRMTSMPDLPATVLKSNCYRSMFLGCSALTTPGIIAATTLASVCCRQMFQNCSGLTSAPVLHATTLANNCYYQMFYNCSSLGYVKAMFTTTPSSTYTNNWLSGVASSGIFVKNSAATWNVSGASGIPSGWTVQTASA